MNQNQPKVSAGRMALGILIAVVLSLATPYLLMTEASMLMPLIMLSSVAMVALYVYAGRVPVLVSIVLELYVCAFLLGTTFMWMLLLAGILPFTAVTRGLAARRPFGEQLRLALCWFIGGVLGAVLVAYLSFGSDMIGNLLNRLSQALRALPAEYADQLRSSLSALMSVEMTLEEFYARFDEIIRQLTAVYQLWLPGMLFSGAILSALLSTLIGNSMLQKRGLATQDSYRPLREIFLPASTTWGLVLIMCAGQILTAFNLPQGEAVLNAIFAICACAFSIQAFASILRRLLEAGAKHWIARLLLVAIAVLMLLIPYALDVVAVYGCGSAVFGTRGAFRQRAEQKKKDDDRSDDHHSDDGE